MVVAAADMETTRERENIKDIPVKAPWKMMNKKAGANAVNKDCIT